MSDSVFENLSAKDLFQLMFESEPVVTHTAPMSTHSKDTSLGIDYWPLGSAISLGDASNKTMATTASNPFLDSLMFELASTPMTQAMGESPMMETPFLDASTATPFTPATTFTPCIDSFHSTPYASHSFTMDSTDIQVSSYLHYESPMLDYATTPWVMDSVADFNGNPAQLMLQTTTEDTTTADMTADILFPPLPADSNVFSDTTNHSYPINTVSHDMIADSDAFLYSANDISYDAIFGVDLEDIAPSALLKRRNSTDIDTASIPHRKRHLSTAPTATTAITAAARRFTCDICHSKFSRRYNLGTHIKTHSKDRQKDFTCFICTKGFDRKHDCDRHIATVHLGERSYACTHCTSSFSRKDALSRHLTQKHSMHGM